MLLWREAVFKAAIRTNGCLLLFQIGITLQPVALHRNVYASVVEDMILKVGASRGRQPGRVVASQAVWSKGQGQKRNKDNML